MGIPIQREPTTDQSQSHFSSETAVYGEQRRPLLVVLCLWKPPYSMFHHPHLNNKRRLFAEQRDQKLGARNGRLAQIESVSNLNISKTLQSRSHEAVRHAVHLQPEVVNVPLVFLHRETIDISGPTTPKSSRASHRRSRTVPVRPLAA